MSIDRLDLYRIFMTAVETGSYTAAGQHLFITQSAVSQAIRQLENALEVQLFYRSGRTMSLTQEGAVLRHHLEQAFQNIDLGERSLNALRQMTEGTLHVASSDTLSRYVLLPWLEQFHEAFPGIRLQITNRPSPACTDLVITGQADIALINRPQEDVPNALFTNVLPYRDGFVAGSKYRILSLQPQTLSQMSKEPLVLLEPDSSTRQNLDTWAKINGIFFQPEIELGSVDVLLELVRMNLGIGWIPGYALPAAEALGLHRIETLEESPLRHVALSRGKNFPETRSAHAFWKLVTENTL